MAVGEWDQRQLCPDGGCVGVIGPDGVCKVCGRAAQNWGDERKRGLIDPPEEEEQDDEDDEEEDDLAADAAEDDEDDGDDDDDEDEDDDEEDDDVVAASSSPGDWGSRQLCPDGACIGLIGPDGKCKVCGRAASDVEPASAPAPAAVSAADPASAEQPGAPASDAASDAGSKAAPPEAVTAADPDATKGARCADATCSGVSGPDGRCDVCGKVVP